MIRPQQAQHDLGISSIDESPSPASENSVDSKKVGRKDI